MHICPLSYRVIILANFLLCCLFTTSSGCMARKISTTHTSATVLSAVIINSRSTNTCSYHIEVRDNGHVSYGVCDRQGQSEIPLPLAHQFFIDLKSSPPLDTLPFIRCLKSVSFGSTITIQYAGARSPDLSYPSLNIYVTNLYDNATTIQLA
jgi:hypothetical protein